MQRLRIKKEKCGIRSSGGFTLIEVIMVLFIIGVITAVATSVIFYRQDTVDLKPQMELFKGHLRYAQAAAMNSSNNTWGIHIIDGSTYCLFRNGNTNDRFILPGEKFDTYTLPAGMTIDPAGGIIAFDQWGAPSENQSGTPDAETDIVLNMLKGADSKVITITRKTGFIR